MNLIKTIRRERDAAFADARLEIARVRYSDTPLWPFEIAEAVRHARVKQWNAAVIYRWKMKQLLRKTEAA